MLFRQLLHLLRLQASIGEHANLGSDVVPVVLAAKLLQIFLEESTHGDDTVSHTLDFAEPLLLQLGVVEDLRRDAGTVNRWVGVKRADKNLDLGVDTLLLFGRFTNNGECTNTLAIKPLRVSLLVEFKGRSIRVYIPCSWRMTERG